eukprot:3936304-Rhodomonas_salina.1
MSEIPAPKFESVYFDEEIEEQHGGSHEPGRSVPQPAQESPGKTRSGRTYQPGDPSPFAAEGFSAVLTATVKIRNGQAKSKFHKNQARTKPKFKAKKGTHPLDPPNTAAAMASPQAQEWLEGIRREIEGLIAKGTYREMKLPAGKKAIPTRLVFKVKTNKEGEVTRYKVRLVVKGFHQVKGLDFDESFAPTAHATGIRTVLAMANAEDWDITQIDVEQAFLNSEMGDKEVYVLPPEGVPNPRGFVWRLQKFLYGQKDAPRAWHQTFKTWMVKYGFEAAGFDECTYILRDPTSSEVQLIVVSYVDDCIVTCPKEHREVRDKFLREFNEAYKITDDGDLTWHLGVSYERDREKGLLHCNQEKYCQDLLRRFGMENCNPAKTPLPPGTK